MVINLFLFFLVSLCIISLLYLLPFVLRLTEQYKLQKYCSKAGILALTYDDGPGQRLTNRLLEIFDKEHVKVTFFFLGMRAEKNPGIVHQAKEMGHEIGFHGHNHINYWKISPKKSLIDIKKGYETLSQELTEKVIFRPPFGKLPLIPLLLLKLKRIRIGWWTYVSGDTFNKFRSIDKIVAEVSKKKGGVVLLHDHDRINHNVHPEPFVLELTQRLILMAKQNNLKIKKLGDVIEEMDNN